MMRDKQEVLEGDVHRKNLILYSDIKVSRDTMKKRVRLHEYSFAGMRPNSQIHNIMTSHCP